MRARTPHRQTPGDRRRRKLSRPGDLKEMTGHRDDADRGKAFFTRTFALCSRLMLSIVEQPQPVIAEVE